MELRRYNYVAAAVLTVAAVAVVASDSAVASNMAFKMNKAIAADTGPFPSGENLVALPFRNPLATLADLCTVFTLPTGASVVQYPNDGSPSPIGFTCGDPPGGSLGLVPRLGVVIRDSTASTTGIVVGSHVPGALLHPIVDQGVFPDGNNIITVPYHTTAVTANDICVQFGLPGDGGGPIVDSVVNRYDAPGGAVFSFTCGDPAAAAFALVLGESVQVFTPAGTATISISPAHF